MAELPRFVPSACTSYTEINPALKRSVGVLDTPLAELTYLENKLSFERFLHQHPLVRHFDRHRDAGTRKITDFVAIDQWRRTELYTQFYRRFPVDYQMVVPILNEPGTIVGIAFNRADRDFDETDRAILEDLRPHLCQAYRNAIAHSMAVWRAEAAERGLESLNGGVIVVARDMTIQDATPLAERDLADFFALDTARGAALPARIANWLAGLAAGGAADGDGADPPAPPLAVETGSGRLTVRRMPSGDGDRHLLVTERFIPAVSSAPLRSLGLTAREAEVLFWIAQGKTNPEIAIIHGASARTVKKQVEQILMKLAVGNRTAAAVLAIDLLRRGPTEGEAGREHPAAD